MRLGFTILLPAALLAACSSDHTRPELRVALDMAKTSLRASVPVAIAEANGSAAVRGNLITGTQPAFQVSAFAGDRVEDVRIDAVNGSVVSMARSNLTSAPCTDSIAMDAALGIAENAVGGEAVASVPDDDVACALEIQVMVGDVLHEVKVAGDGQVLETELSDELNGGDGD